MKKTSLIIISFSLLVSTTLAQSVELKDPCEYSPWTQENYKSLSIPEIRSKLTEEVTLKEQCLERERISQELSELSGKSGDKRGSNYPELNGVPEGLFSGSNNNQTQEPKAVTSKLPGFYYSSTRIKSAGGISGQEEIVVLYQGKKYLTRVGGKLPDQKGRINSIKYQGSKIKVYAKETNGSLTRILWVDQVANDVNDTIFEETLENKQSNVTPPPLPVNLLEGVE